MILGLHHAQITVPPPMEKAAVRFYAEVLGGTPAITTFGEFGMGADSPQAEQVMHAILESPSGLTLMVSDLLPGMDYQPGTNVTISLSGDDEAALRGYWEKLASDGTVSTALEKQMWGDIFGECTDKFGLKWVVNITQNA